MRLHLPLILLAALISCSSLAYADYVWSYSNESGTYTSTEWNTPENWTGGTITANGPQSPTSGNYDPIDFNNGKTISFSGLSLEGWNPRFVVQNGTTVTLGGSIKKIQTSTAEAYIKVDATSKLTWDLTNSGGGNSGGVFTLDIQSYKGLDIRKSFNASGKTISSLTVSLGTLGSILSTGSAASLSTTITFNNTALLQSYETGFTTNSGQYTSTVTDGYILNTRKLWEVTDSATIGGTLSSSSTFTLNSGTALTASTTALTAVAADLNKFYLYVATDGSICVDYVTQVISGESTWTATTNGDWGNAANWSTNTAPTSSADIAKFVDGNNLTVTVNQEVKPNMVSIAGTSYTFQSSNSGSITGSGNLTVDVTDKVTMNLANTYTGGTSVKNGTLVVGVTGALGTGAVTVESGGTLQITPTGNTSTIVSGGITINGGTLAFTTAGDHNLNQVLGGSNAQVLVSGTGTNLTISQAQGKTAQTTVKDGASLTIQGGGSTTQLTGNLSLSNGSSLTTQGDTFGYSNPASGGFGTLSLSGGSTWNVTSSNTTLGNTTIVLNASKIVMNCGSNSAHGFDLYTGTNTIRTTADATGMSSIELATGASNSGNHNSVNLRGGTIIFDIARGHFDLTENNTSDLKVDVILAKKENNGQGVGFTKTGDGVLQLTKASTVQLNVNLQAGTILLTDEGTLGTSNVIMSSGSYLTLDSTQAAKTLSNVISGTGTVTQKGSGNVTLSGASTYSGTTLIQSGTLTAGSASAFGTSSLELGNNATLAVGSYKLTNAVSLPTSASSGAQSATITASSGSSIGNLTVGKQNTLTITGDLAWTTNASILLDEGAKLVNFGGTIDWTNNTVTLKLTDANVSTGTSTDTLPATTATAKVESSSLTLNGTTTALVMENETLINLLTAAKNDQKIAALQLGSSTTTLTFSDDTYKKTLLGQSSLLTQLGFAITGIQNGALILNGEKTDVSDIYVVVADSTETNPHTISSYRSLDPYKAIVLDQGQTLTIDLAGAPTAMNATKGLQVSNLVGVAGSSLNVTNTDTSQTALVVLTNPTLATEEEEVTGETVGTNTLMEGDINGSTAVTFLKTGAGTLTVSGGVSADTIQAEEGELVLNGNATLNSLVLHSANTANKTTVSIGGTTTAETLSEENTLVSGSALTGGNLEITSGGQLTLTGENTLEQSTLSGSGTLNLKDGSVLMMSDQAKLSGVAVNLTESGLQLEGAGTDQFTVSSLNGDDNSMLALSDSTLTVNGTGTSSFSGQLVGSGMVAIKNGTMNLTSSAPTVSTLSADDSSGVSLSVENATTHLTASGSDPISYKGITLQNKGNVTVGSSDALNQTLSLGTDGLTLNSGCSLTFNLGTTTEEELQSLSPLVTTTGAITLNGGTVILNNDNNLVAAGSPTLELTLMQGDSAATVNNVGISAGFLSTVYADLALSASGNNVVLTGVAREENIFADDSLSPNSQAGANLLWDSRFTLTNGDSVLKDAYLAVNEMQTNGNASGAAKTLAAIAGSTINATGTAQRDALRSQLSLVRDRTTQMGVNPAYVNADLPYFHLWLEGTGSFAKLNTDGDEGGYKLNTWGGTVGMDVDLSDRLTIGAALSANYGDLSASAAEVATGSLDSYYVSLFGRYQSKRWAHTLILTGGWNNADLNRTVHYGSGSYSTQGSTNGYGIGAMYEVTYDVALNESKSSILQPLANLSVVHTGLDAYTESGAGNAGLNVGKQEWTTATVALGARWLGLVGSNIFGREALAELRVNAAQDMGDSQGKTDVSLIGRPELTQTVRGAKVGTTALQVGAGLSIPVGLQSTIYCNGNADIRSGASALNATLGLRYNF